MARSDPRCDQGGPRRRAVPGDAPGADLTFRARIPARASSSRTRLGPEIDECDRPLDVVLPRRAGAELQNSCRSHRPTTPRAEDTAFILYTSGTTKDPEGSRPTPTPTRGRSGFRRSTGSTPATATSCGARPGRAGRSRSGTSSSARGRWGARRCSTTGASIRSERFELLRAGGCDRALPGADRVPDDGQASTSWRARPPGAPPRRLRRRAAQPGGDRRASATALGLTIHDGYGQTENSLLVANVARRCRSARARWGCRPRGTTSP